MKRKTPFIIFYLLSKDFKPKEVIEMGYSPSTVYRYSSRLKECKKEFHELKKNNFKVV
jgi:hypothetical protein